MATTGSVSFCIALKLTWCVAGVLCTLTPTRSCGRSTQLSFQCKVCGGLVMCFCGLPTCSTSQLYHKCSQRLLTCRAAAALLREVAEQQAYRPTADASAWQSAFLGRFAEAALQVDHLSTINTGGGTTSLLYRFAYLLRLFLVMSASGLIRSLHYSGHKQPSCEGCGWQMLSGLKSRPVQIMRQQRQSF